MAVVVQGRTSDLEAESNMMIRRKTKVQKISGLCLFGEVKSLVQGCELAI